MASSTSVSAFLTTLPEAGKKLNMGKACIRVKTADDLQLQKQ